MLCRATAFLPKTYFIRRCKTSANNNLAHKCRSLFTDLWNATHKPSFTRWRSRRGNRLLAINCDQIDWRRLILHIFGVNIGVYHWVGLGVYHWVRFGVDRWVSFNCCTDRVAPGIFLVYTYLSKCAIYHNHLYNYLYYNKWLWLAVSVKYETWNNIIIIIMA